jgi:hypothetical protein
MNSRAAGFRAIDQEVFQNVLAVLRNEWLSANLALDRPIDCLRSGLDAHDLVTCLALWALEFFLPLFLPIFGHRGAVLRCALELKRQCSGISRSSLAAGTAKGPLISDCGVLDRWFWPLDVEAISASL